MSFPFIHSTRFFALPLATTLAVIVSVPVASAAGSIEPANRPSSQPVAQPGDRADADAVGAKVDYLVEGLESDERDQWWPAAQALGILAADSESKRVVVWKKTNVNSLGMVFRRIEPGTFTMGPDNHHIFNRQMAHRVEITKPYCITATEVTNAQFRVLFPDFEYDAAFSPDDDSPAVNVSSTDAFEFCRRLSEREGATYRLPTEAEWEYACRAGSQTRYCFGDDSDKLDEYGWCDVSIGRAQPVAMLKPNDWGLYDVHGNAAEWVSDFYSNSYYRRCAALGVIKDPEGPGVRLSRVLRGGNWATVNPLACTSTVRYPKPLLSRKPMSAQPAKVEQLIGFRVVREVE